MRTEMLPHLFAYPLPKVVYVEVSRLEWAAWLFAASIVGMVIGFMLGYAVGLDARLRGAVKSRASQSAQDDRR